jgi:hypothetical protein
VRYSICYNITLHHMLEDGSVSGKGNGENDV